MKKILIIIPAFNEEDNIVKVVGNIIQNYPQFDYIIINDGSKDRTSSICEQYSFQIINLPINMGIGGAVQTGYQYAIKNNYDIAIQLDGDGQHDCAYLEDLVKEVENGNEIVIGSRFLEKKGFQSSVARRFGIKFLSKLIFALTGETVKDVTSGFRAVNRRFIEIYSKFYPNDYPEPEAIVMGIMYGAKIKEVPVEMNERMSGSSSITSIKSIYYMIKVTLAIFIARIGYGIRRR